MSQNASGENTTTAGIALRLLLVVLLLLATLVAGFYLDLTDLDVGALLQWARESGPAAALLLAALMIAAVIIGPVPTVPISMAAGALYGPWLGTLLAAGSALVGAVAAFWIARILGKDLLSRFSTTHAEVCPDCSSRLLFWVVFSSRLIPVVSFALVSYAAGLTSMTTRAFAIATFTGMLPMTIVYTAFGASLHAGAVWMGIISGIFIALIVTSPWIVGRYNPLGLRDRLAHLHENRGC